MSDQNCGNCANARWRLTPTGRIKKGESGRCAVPNPTELVIAIPACCQSRDFQRFVIWPDGGEHCPMYQATATPIGFAEREQLPPTGFWRPEIVRSPTTKCPHGVPVEHQCLDCGGVAEAAKQ